MSNPIWIIIDDVFEGHQGHWADCFFSNATQQSILEALKDVNFLGELKPFSIREMTDDEIASYPDAVQFQKKLITEYGEA